MKRSVSLFISVFIFSCSGDKITLPKLNLDRNHVTVSGLSSGGYMAHQYHLAYSDEVSGAALVAGGPFGCARGDLQIALAECINSETPPSVELLYSLLLEYESRRDIASLENIKDDPVLIFHGSKDDRVSLEVSKVQQALYEKLGANVTTEYSIAVGHGFPTLDYGVDCEVTGTPFINQCQYDGARQIFKSLFESVSDKSTVLEEVQAFNQGQFVDEGASNTLADIGYLYIPQACRRGALCRIHIAFHGCLQNEEAIGRAFIENAGFNSWAESNQVVVLYPQSKSSYMPLNPKACWDWWGYTGSDYQTRKGAQLKQIHNMVSKL